MCLVSCLVSGLPNTNSYLSVILIASIIDSESVFVYLPTTQMFSNECRNKPRVRCGRGTVL